MKGGHIDKIVKRASRGGKRSLEILESTLYLRSKVGLGCTVLPATHLSGNKQ